MAKVTFSNEAVADLESIDDRSILDFGEEVAALYLRGFSEVFALLRDHPMAGPPTVIYGANYRCFVHRKNRVFYQVENDTILIVRILHHAMDVTRALKGAMR